MGLEPAVRSWHSRFLLFLYRHILHFARNENVTNLKHNGKIFFINRSLELLKPTSDRPLTSNVDDLKKKYDERLPIYKNTCDVEIDGDVDYSERIVKILNHLM